MKIKLCLFPIVILLLLFAAIVHSELKSQTFDLPSLIIHVDQSYLLRKVPRILSCQLSPGWSEARLDTVYWIKDGVKLEIIIQKIGKEDYVIDGPSLTIVGGKQQNEGDYQCVAEVSGVRLSNRQVVKTTLVSSPIKLRRARITKFDQTTNHYVKVREGEVARLPCAGLPDVVPGPAEICFEKSGVEGCFSDKMDSKYLSTATGMQIAFAQTEHAGEYHCVVKNEFTKQTRKSLRYVKLIVDEPNNSTDLLSLAAEPPQLVFPSKENKIDSPIIVDVVANQEVILECIFMNAKIIWTKHGDTTPQISLTDDDARMRQIWGNLRIRGVSQGDSGIYSCHGLSLFDDSFNINDSDHPRVYYSLVVHAPTDTHLELNQNFRDKSWELSCLAKNLRYEIPMVYVNGTSLIDAIDQMGVASSTNFYTNPINATIRVKNNYSGSIQCISRPAMDEAEVYGAGLERGRSHNLYVISSSNPKANLITKGPENVTATVGEDVELICLVQKVNIKYWLKDGEYVKIFGADRTKLVGSNSLKISKIEPKDEGWYTCVVSGEGSEKSKEQAYLKVVPLTTTDAPVTTTEPFIIKKKDDFVTMEDVRGFVVGSNVRIQWSVIGKMEALTSVAGFRIELRREGSQNESWIEADKVGSHVRATTIKDLIPNNKYQFRVILLKEDNSIVESNATTWMTVDLPQGDTIPPEPMIEFLSLISPTAVRIGWSHLVEIPNARARHFIVIYTPSGREKSLVARIEGNFTQTDIINLEEHQTYKFNVMAENHAGKSQLSPSMSINTTLSNMDESFLFFRNAFSADLSMQTIVLVIASLFLALLMLLICCIVCCNIRGKKSSIASKSANGKFLDTSFRIFNEQKIHKSRLYNDSDHMFTMDELDECSPLKTKSDDKFPDLTEKFNFDALPNLYGNTDDMEKNEYAEAPNDPTYVSAVKIIGSSAYAVPTARCYSPDSGTSHEMLVPSSGNTLNGSFYNPLPPAASSPQRVMAYKCSDSLLYSPVGTGSSIADTSSSGIQMTRITCDSPTNPPTDSSDQGIRCGGSSRNSQISSTEGATRIQMHTFKSSAVNTTSFMGGTFDRRLREQLVE